MTLLNVLQGTDYDAGCAVYVVAQFIDSVGSGRQSRSGAAGELEDGVECHRPGTGGVLDDFDHPRLTRDHIGRRCQSSVTSQRYFEVVRQTQVQRQ